MKKFITLLILLCTVIGAKAISVSVLQDGTVQITKTQVGDLGNLSNDDQNLVKNASSISIVGPLGNDDFLKLRDWGTHPTTVDLSGATISQSILKCVYKSDNGDYYPAQQWEFSDFVEYTSSDASFPPIINQNGVDYKLFYATTTDDCRLPEAWASTLTTLSLPNNANYKIVNSNFCNGFSNLSSVTIPDNVKVIGNSAFMGCSSLTSINLNKVEYFCYQAFYQPAIEVLTIPGTAVYIGKNAFADDNGVKKLVFSEPPLNDPYPDPDHYMIIKQEAFNNQKSITDIYINTTSNYVCENWAFSMEMTYAHGDPNSSYTILHFPTSVAEHYSNLKHPLTVDIAKDPARFHNWLMNHYSQAQVGQNSKGNGWWEFVNTGTIDPDDPPVEGGKVLRTYSDYYYDRIVPRGLKAYIVTGLNPRIDGNYEVSLTQLLVIPKRTGVILYGVPNSKNDKGQPIISLQPVQIANGYPLRRDYWYKLTDEDKPFMKNYLWPTSVANDPDSLINETYLYYTLNSNGELVQENGEYLVQTRRRTVLGPKNMSSSINPYDPEDEIVFNQGKVTYNDDNDGYDITVLNGFYRNFYLNYYSLTDLAKETPVSANENYIGFFRAKSSSMKSGHAYLRLYKDEYPNAEGMEVIVNPDTEPFQNGQYTYTIGNNQYIMENYQVEYNISDGAPLVPTESGLWKQGSVPDIIWENPSNWGVRPSRLGVQVKYVGEPIIEDEDGHATMIIGPVQDNEVKDPYFYTIQGVRIAKPTAPGIYIHNGKKVVIK